MNAMQVAPAAVSAEVHAVAGPKTPAPRVGAGQSIRGNAAAHPLHSTAAHNELGVSWWCRLGLATARR